jgi:predicted transcriptional regulator
MSTTTTIRVGTSTRDAVNHLRDLTGESTDSIIEKALAAYLESLFWQRWREADHDEDPDLALWDAASAVDLLQPPAS